MMALKMVLRRQLQSVDTAGIEALLLAVHRCRGSAIGASAAPSQSELADCVAAMQLLQARLDSLLSFVDAEQLSALYRAVIGLGRLLKKPPDDQADIEAITDVVYAALMLLRRVAGWRPRFEERELQLLIPLVQMGLRLQLLPSDYTARWLVAQGQNITADRQSCGDREAVSVEAIEEVHPAVLRMLSQLSEQSGGGSAAAANDPSQPGRGRRLLLSIAQAIDSYNRWVRRCCPSSERADSKAGQLLSLAEEAVQCIEEWGPGGIEFGMLCAELPRIKRLLRAHLRRCSDSGDGSRILHIQVAHIDD